jgi:hypothetical protein
MSSLKMKRTLTPLEDETKPFPSSNAAEKIEAAREKGRQIVEEKDAADALLGIKNTELTPEQIAEFESAAYTAVDEELGKFITGGKRKKMRGGEVSEVIAKSSELWKAVLKTVGTPDNAAIAIVGTTVGIASPALVHTAFSVARTALDVAARAITPETVATSRAYVAISVLLSAPSKMTISMGVPV